MSPAKDSSYRRTITGHLATSSPFLRSTSVVSGALLSNLNTQIKPSGVDPNFSPFKGTTSHLSRRLATSSNI